MSHAEENFLSVPAHLSLKPEDGADGRIDDFIRLPVLGQGTVGLMIAQKEAFSVGIHSKSWGAPALGWHIDFAGVTLHEHISGEWRALPTMPNPNLEPGLLLGLDPDPCCTYWFSFDYHNRMLRYGKGEMRCECTVVEFQLPPKPTDGSDDPYLWMKEARRVEVTGAIRDTVDIWRDPVTARVPMKVVTHDAMTLDMMAGGEVTVPANLSATCQQLYDNVAGRRFRLDTTDFPQFAQAVKGTVRNFVREAIGWNGKDHRYGNRQGRFGPASGWP